MEEDQRPWMGEGKILPPPVIYLQFLDEFGESVREVTWCQDRIHDTDVAYILQVGSPIIIEEEA